MKQIFEVTPILTDKKDIDRIVAQVNKKPTEESMAYAKLCIDALHNIYKRIGQDKKQL